jgi:DNA repair photolyase
MVDSLNKIVRRGRGALENPTGRFERITQFVDEDAWGGHGRDPEEDAQPQQVETQVFRDCTKSIVTTNDSPDAPEASVNPYRGCEHGCIYCFARPGHEYFGLSLGLDFETKIFAKPDAPKLLEETLSKKTYVPRTIMMSGNTDCYQPIERKMGITRQCMEVFRDFRHPVCIVTKNHLVTRDVDVLAEMAQHDCIAVYLSVTTLDGKLSRLMEPRASQPHMRLRAIETLAKAGVPVGCMVGPIVPGLTDHETPNILKAVADAGGRSAGYTIMRLPYGVKDLFQTWMHEHYPDRAERVLSRIRDMRDGKLNDAEFGTRMRGTGPFADQIAQMFATYKKKYNLTRSPSLTLAHYNREARSRQGNLF